MAIVSGRVSLRVLRTTSRHFDARERGKSGNYIIKLLGKTCGLQLRGKKDWEQRKQRNIFKSYRKAPFVGIFGGGAESLYKLVLSSGPLEIVGWTGSLAKR